MNFETKIIPQVLIETWASIWMFILFLSVLYTKATFIF